MNNWVIAGRVGRDAEQRFTGGGQSVVNFSVAIDNGKDKDSGEPRKPTWVNVAMWGDRWQKLSQYITAGKFVVVSGRASARTYESNGQSRVSLDMTAYDFTFGGGPSNGGNNTAAQGGDTQQRTLPPDSGTTTNAHGAEISDEDIPF